MAARSRKVTMPRAVDAQAGERDAQLGALVDVTRERVISMLHTIAEVAAPLGATEPERLTLILAELIVSNTLTAARIDAMRDAAGAADWPALRECSRWMTTADDLAALCHGDGLVLRAGGRGGVH